MPKLVQKCGYIRNGSAAKYMRYIATREGVEKLHGRGPVTQPQKELIERLLKDYPDTKELFEYSDYCASPTFGNASELITMALDANVHTMEAGDGYLKYIATRPRVEKRGDHGLFSDTQDVSLQDMMAEVAEHHGPVWTVILSLRREDASALGYDSAENWRTLLLQHRTRLAQAMKIPVDDFRWCAAFHDEGYHPHVHMMVWSADEKHGYFAKEKTLFEDSKYHNCVFVGTDEQGTPRHAHKRSANSFGKSFRQNVEGSDPRYSFHHIGTDGKLYVFEAPIDMLSFITMYPDDWKSHSYVACCGTSAIPVMSMLSRMPCTQEVFLCLDNDAAGQAASLRMAEQIAEQFGIASDRLTPQNKDWNDDLCALEDAQVPFLEMG